MRQRVIIALGGNAILNKGEKGTYQEQVKNVSKTMEGVADLIVNPQYQVVITHGNGPQVGTIMSQQTAASKIAPEMPMHMAGAMTQGQIGYLIQQSLFNILNQRGNKKNIATIITQTLVDKDSPGFKNPTKPVGSYYTKEEAEKIKKEMGYVLKEDAGRGYRRVVPSPLPLKILEIDTIENLVDNGTLVIAGGGGGVPVIEKNDSWLGVDAVIDKDRAAALMGDLLDAQLLIILTAVEKVCLNYQQPNEINLDQLNIDEAEKYLKEGHFAEGSMGPKIEAAVAFVKAKWGRKALITHAKTLKEALSGKNGTWIQLSDN